MEVHTHAHTQRSNWRHYFWEFLMLFLAVFCGFLAEYKLEHMIEHQREKEFMTSMLEDLKSDTAILHGSVTYWDSINQSIDSVSDAIQVPPENTDFIKLYRNINKAVDYYSFTYNDRTISQLKNSGGFRLIRKKNVGNKIILYDQFNIDAIKKIADMHVVFYETVMRLSNKVLNQDLINKIFNKHSWKKPPTSENNWIDSIRNKAGVPLPTDIYTATMFEFKNALNAYRKNFYNMTWGYEHLNIQMIDLIELIKTEYKLND